MAQKLKIFFLIVLSYYATARVGLYMALPPGFATAFWPPAGIAISAMIVAGPAYFPAVFFGALLANIFRPFGVSFNVAAVLIAAGSTVQALAGWALVRRFCARSLELLTMGEIARFFGSVIACCVISPTVGVTSLWMLGFVAGGDFAVNWVMWFLGDAIGGLIFAPVGLLFFMKPRDKWLPRAKSVSFPLLFAFLFCVMLYQYVRASEERRVLRDLEVEAEKITRSIQDGFDHQELALTALAGMSDAARGFDVGAFQRMANALMPELPGIRALEWVPSVKREDVEKFQRMFSRESGRPFLIYEKRPDGLPTPVAERSVYYPVTYVAPLESNQKAIGYDLGSQKTRADAIQKALASGRTAMTEKIQLVQASGGSRGGVLLFYPARDFGQNKFESHDAQSGFFVGVFDIESLLRPLVDARRNFGIEWTVVDRDAGQNQDVLSMRDTVTQNPDFGGESFVMNSDGVYYRFEVRLADRVWSVLAFQSKLRLVSEQSRLSWVVLTLSLVICSGLGLFLMVLTGRTTQVELLVAERTVDLEKARNEAILANKSKGEFLANMSHEIRTPMNGILGMATMLADSSLSAEQRGYVNVIQESGDSLLALLNNILDFSKIDAGRVELEDRPLDLHRIIKGVMDLLQPIASKKSIILSVRWDDSLPRFILGDELRLRQILLNLISNAIKFTPRGSVTVTINASGGSDVLVVDVRDTGDGIPADKLERIFQKFAQADGSTTRRFGGSGLGLGISRALARLMGGDITVASVVGEGSTFTLRLPLRVTDKGPETDEAISTAGESQVDLSRLRILVAEDNLTNQMLIKGFLRKLGIDPVFAPDGKEAVRLGLSNEFDIILMDLHMPELDGLGASVEILGPRQKGKRPTIIALTADAFPEMRQECLAAGMSEFLTKPLKFSALKSALERFSRV